MLVRGAAARGIRATRWSPPTTRPFPTPESKAGARAFPLMLPTDARRARRRGRPARARGAARRRAARSSSLWADSDPIIPFEVGERFAEPRQRRRRREKIENASHFLQEDAGEEIGRRIADWLSA